MTLADEFAKFKALKKHKGEFGIEIETEAKVAYHKPNMAFWTVHNDDSLRGPAPYEYVLKVPLMFEKEVPEALIEFKSKIDGIEFNQSSFTTSVHVHINFLNEKFLTLGNFLTVYCIVENLLKKFAGPSRESNLFCLPLSDAEENFGFILHVLDCIQKRRFNHLEIEPNSSKYAALNMSALWKYGSLEIRLLRGTTDIKIIEDWVGILNSLLVYSRQDITPKDIILAWKKRGNELLTDIFGKYRKLLKFPDEDKLVEQNFWFAANCAVSIPDWRALDKEQAPKKLSSKNLDELSIKIYGSSFEALTEEQKHVIIKNFKYIEDADNAFLKAAAQGQAAPKVGKKKPVNAWIDPNAANAIIDAVLKPVVPQFHPDLEQPAPNPFNIQDEEIEDNF
jgi:hypothetical protein